MISSVEPNIFDNLEDTSTEATSGTASTGGFIYNNIGHTIWTLHDKWYEKIWKWLNKPHYPIINWREKRRLKKLEKKKTERAGWDE